MDNLKVTLGQDVVRARIFNRKNISGKGSRRVGAKAKLLMKRLGATQASFKFFCGAIHQLPEATVERAAIAALELGHNPPAYFNKCIQNEIAKRQMSNKEKPMV